MTLKVAVSKDGFVGYQDRPTKLTGLRSDRWMHRQRAAVDAIAVGSTTILTDDPLLTARLVYRERPLTRVIFDRRGRVNEQARVFGTREAGPVIVTTESVAAAVARLGEQGIVSLVVEGGPTLHHAFWKAGMVDRVQIIETPAVLGAGVSAFRPSEPADARRLRIGDDVLIDWDVYRTH